MPKRILIVDHQRHLRTLLESALEPLLDAGIEIASVDSGLRALEAAEERAPDLVLVDVSLPGMPATELCRQLRQLEGQPSACIIVMCNQGQQDDLELWRAAGADDFLVKPFDPDEIVDRLSRILGIEPMY